MFFTTSFIWEQKRQNNLNQKLLMTNFSTCFANVACTATWSPLMGRKGEIEAGKQNQQLLTLSVQTVLGQNTKTVVESM